MLKVGTIVKLVVPCLGNQIGTVGICYEEYDLGEPGAGSVIFENGNYDGFSPLEQERFLEEIGYDDAISHYGFTNVMNLSRHYDEGMFTSIFESAKMSQHVCTEHVCPVCGITEISLVHSQETGNCKPKSKIVVKPNVMDILKNK